LCLTTCSTCRSMYRRREKRKGRTMPKLTFWTVKRRKRLAALAAKGLSAREIAPRLAGPEHAPTAVAVRTVAARYGIALVNRGGRPPKRKRRGKRT